MSVYRITSTFPANTGLPEDSVTNTLHFDNTTGPDYTNLVDIVDDFYQATPTGYTALRSYMPEDLLADEIQYAVYKLSDSIPRAPVHEETRSCTFGTNAPLPPEVALVLSFQSVKVSGLKQASRRNRIYLGPFSTNTNASGVPLGTMIDSIARSARDMLAAANSSIDWEWITFSPTLNSSETVDNGWIDNAWDTQRRRGRSATGRDLWDDSNP